MKRLFAALIFLLVLAACTPQPPVQKDTQPVQSQQTSIPQPPPEQIATTISPARDLTGNWQGSITFTNNCINPSCRYHGRLNPPSITMNLAQNGNAVNGVVNINFANFEIEQLIPGQNCGTFEQLVRQRVVSQSAIDNGVISSSRFTFIDVGDNSWDFRLTTDLLEGTVSSEIPGCMGIQSDKVALSRVS